MAIGGRGLVSASDFALMSFGIFLVRRVETLQTKHWWFSLAAEKSAIVGGTHGSWAGSYRRKVPAILAVELP